MTIHMNLVMIDSINYFNKNPKKYFHHKCVKGSKKSVSSKYYNQIFILVVKKTKNQIVK